jgi:hypothetical protein
MVSEGREEEGEEERTKLRKKLLIFYLDFSRVIKL